jgi:hypothetical protein
MAMQFQPGCQCCVTKKWQLMYCSSAYCIYELESNDASRTSKVLARVTPANQSACYDFPATLTIDPVGTNDWQVAVAGVQNCIAGGNPHPECAQTSVCCDELNGTWTLADQGGDEWLKSGVGSCCGGAFDAWFLVHG